jgi:flavorubredoxin
MAWSVAVGVHAAFQSHIRHHPNSPTHGHIVYGHTSNITFLDVIDADAIIIGSPVYNGNVHPDVQNVSAFSDAQ